MSTALNIPGPLTLQDPNSPPRKRPKIQQVTRLQQATSDSARESIRQIPGPNSWRKSFETQAQKALDELKKEKPPTASTSSSSAVASPAADVPVFPWDMPNGCSLDVPTEAAALTGSTTSPQPDPVIESAKSVTNQILTILKNKKFTLPTLIQWERKMKEQGNNAEVDFNGTKVTFEEKGGKSIIAMFSIEGKPFFLKLSNIKTSCKPPNDINKIRNSVTIHDSGESGSFVYSLMPEIIKGTELFYEIAEKEAKFNSSWFIQLVKIIEDIHGMGWLHRDIKSENFMITQDGKVILIDTEGIGPNLSGGLKSHGTLSFKPPKDRQDMYGQPTKYSDLWALGLTLLTLFYNSDQEIGHVIGNHTTMGSKISEKLREIYNEIKRIKGVNPDVYGNVNPFINNSIDSKLAKLEAQKKRLLNQLEEYDTKIIEVLNEKIKDTHTYKEYYEFILKLLKDRVLDTSLLPQED